MEQFIFLATIAAASYFSYRSGYSQGVIEGVDSCLEQLEEQGILKIDDSE
jgi:hypothetical protein